MVRRKFSLVTCLSDPRWYSADMTKVQCVLLLLAVLVQTVVLRAVLHQNLLDLVSLALLTLSAALAVWPARRLARPARQRVRR